MNEKIEIQGKTVEEAVNEALLRLGARRDEVDVTVLDEPKSGFLGILGGKPARVEVSRKRSRRRGQRRPSGKQEAHDFGDSPDNQDSGRSRGRSRGRRGGGGGRDSRDGRDNRDNRDGRDNREARDNRGGRDDQKRDNRRKKEDRPEPRPRQEAAATGNDHPEEKKDGRSSGRSRSRRGRRGRGGRGGDRAPQDAQDNQNDQSNQNNEQTKPRQAAARVEEGPRSTTRQDPRKTRSRNQRGRRRDQEEAPRQVENLDTPMDAPIPDHVRHDAPEMVAERPQREGRGRPRRERGGPRRREETPDAGAPMTSNRDAIDEIIAQGISVEKYAQALRGVGEEDLNSTLENMTSGLLARAGFPSRCQVQDGEYRQVRVVTGDDGAAVLIGRHGSTVDSVEHLIERMISTAHGDRVRMNLDINNYRRRRQDTLLQRVEEAVAQVRETGKAYHVEPMNARERRIVHLAAEDFDGMRTFTMDSHRGRHVVIALDDNAEAKPAVAADDQPLEEETMASVDTGATMDQAPEEAVAEVAEEVAEVEAAAEESVSEDMVAQAENEDEPEEETRT